MINSRMIALFGIYTRDLQKKDFPKELRIEIFNSAQDRALDLLDRHNLTVLDASELSKDLDSNGIFDLNDLTTQIYEHSKGIDEIKITDGYYCDKITYSEYRTLKNMGFSFTARKPIYYVRGAKVYVEPYENSTKIDIFYLRKPFTMDINYDIDGVHTVITIMAVCRRSQPILLIHQYREE